MTSNRVPLEGKTRLDFWQAASGALLALFVCVHLVLEGTVVISPALTNGIAWLLEVTWLAQIAAPVILLLIVFHFYIAARKMPFRAHELGIFVQHSKSLKDFDTWLWLVQVVTAIVILVMASAHVINILSNLPISADKSAAAIQGGMVPFYLVLFAALDLHIAIGLYRVGVKFGILNRENRLKWRKYALYLVIGLALLSLATHYSFATMAI